MHDHTCSFCAHSFTGRRRKFCYDCLPAYGTINSAMYQKRYNDLYRACGFMPGPEIVASKWSPPGGQQNQKAANKKVVKPDHSCAGCEAIIPGARKWCSEKCRAANHRHGVRRQQGRTQQLTRDSVPATPGVCKWCGVAFSPSHHHRFACSAECSIALKRESWRRKNIRRRTAQVGEPYTIRELRERDGDRCHLCCKIINFDLPGNHPRGPHIDHLVPLSAGGADCKTNVKMAHAECNLKRGTGGSVQLLLVG